MSFRPSQLPSYVGRAAMSEASEVTLLSGGYVTTPSSSLPPPPISVIISVIENKALSEEEATARGAFLRDGQRLELCHRSDRAALCAGSTRASPGYGSGTVGELPASLPSAPCCTTVFSAGSSNDHMLRMRASSSQTDVSKPFLALVSHFHLLSLSI